MFKNFTAPREAKSISSHNKVASAWRAVAARENALFLSGKDADSVIPKFDYKVSRLKFEVYLYTNGFAGLSIFH
jgi:hypothetical protein